MIQLETRDYDRARDLFLPVMGLSGAMAAVTEYYGCRYEQDNLALQKKGASSA